MTAPAIKTTTLRSDDFSCPSCVNKIETKLGGLGSVTKFR